VDLNDLIYELKVLQLTLLDRQISAMEISDFVREVDSNPKFLLLIKSCFASVERSFSKLKLLKNYLRSVMS
jgi:hypothetical protein